MTLMQRLVARMPRLASLAHVLRQVPVAFGKRAGTGARDYVVQAIEITERVPATDPACAFYLRCLLEGGHDRFIEIGAYNGARIVTVKRLLPAIDAVGLDICSNYQTPFTRFGVAFGPFIADGLPEPAGRTLLASRGTLTYVPLPALNRFFAHVAARGFDLAIVEPMPTFPIDRTIRRGGGSLYHPYPDLLRAHGFVDLPDQADGCRFHDYLPMLESWYFGLAQNARATREGAAGAG